MRASLLPVLALSPAFLSPPPAQTPRVSGQWQNLQEFRRRGTRGRGVRRPLRRAVSTECASPKSDDRERTQKGSPYTIHRFTREVVAATTHQQTKHTNYRVINVTRVDHTFLSSLLARRRKGLFIQACLFCSQHRCALHGAMSYYINGPRIFTPSTFKQSKQFLPMESFGSTVEQAKEQPPNPINTCHRARFANLQHTHPSTWRSAFPLLNQQIVASLLPLALA